MYSRWQLSKKYLQYYLSASNGKGHGIHSPFVFEFVTQVLNDQSHYYAYEQVENLRRELLTDKSVLEVEDFGAGSTVNTTNRWPVARLAKYAAKPKKYAQLLFRIVKHYQPKTILELGTSLGISSSYMALANPAAQLVTGEGCRSIAAKAANNFRKLSIAGNEIVTGNFDITLPMLLARLPSVDLAFLDGNHRLEPTLRYFEQLLPQLNEHAIVILDDIHWSEGMEQAWEKIKDHPAVTLSIDLFFIGLVLFRKDFKVKQHFTIRY